MSEIETTVPAETAAVEGTEVTSAPQTESSEQVTAPEPESQEGQAPEGEEEAAAAAAAYAPNYKYKGLGEEKEFEDWAKPLVTSKEIEDKFREMHARAFGIDKYKEDFYSARRENESLNAGLDTLRGFIKEGDLDSFFQATKIPEQVVWNWVKEKLAYQELSPEEKKRYDDYWGAKRENFRLAQTNQKYQNDLESTQVQRKEMELATSLSSPEVTRVMQEFDARVGKPGAFRDLVIREGLTTEQLTGKECSAEQAVQAVLRYMPGFGGNQIQQTRQANANGVVPPKETKATIPNIKGKATSPVKKKYQSFDEMKKDFAERRKSLASD